ncbi:MAG: hypothetical protein AB7N76_35115 [Planctomycetota bacterium]
MRLLCLYDGTEQPEAHLTDLARYFEGPANHLGLRCDFHDVSQGLPPDAVLARCRGILTRFQDDTLPGADRYLRWLSRTVRAGTPALVLGNLGAELEAAGSAPVDSGVLAEAWGALGLELDRDPALTINPLRLEVVRKEPAWVEHERELAGELGWFRGVHATDPRARVLLALRRRDGRGGEAHAVVLTRSGGFVGPTYALWQEPRPPYRSAWRVDPYRLLSAAFHLEGLPRPDPTTLQGARIFYSQIDGDGFESLSRVEPGRLCAEVMRDRVLRRTALPTTIGFIAAPLDPEGLGKEHPEWRGVARSIFALPHVEPASHTFTHPFDWDERTVAYQVPGYRPDGVAEVERSLRLLAPLCPPHKPLRVFLWSGDCTPGPEAIAAVASRGLVNLNGGETRRDRAFPSAADGFPYARRRGGAFQVHATNANENVYTEGWQGGFDRLRHVRETWERTDRPRRTYAADLFYHFYSAERAESLDALLGLQRYAASRPDWIPIPASRYCAIVAGFDAARLRRHGSDRFEVRDQGELRTLRFDDEARELDLARCVNVLGAARREGTLWVHLAGPEPAVVALRAGAPRRPHLVRATVPVAGFVVEGEGLRFAVESAPWGRVLLGGLRPGAAYRVVGVALAEDPIADAEGRLELPARGPAQALALELRDRP